MDMNLIVDAFKEIESLCTKKEAKASKAQNGSIVVFV
jgi:hypothetical protein